MRLRVRMAIGALQVTYDDELMSDDDDDTKLFSV